MEKSRAVLDSEALLYLFRLSMVRNYTDLVREGPIFIPCEQVPIRVEN